ncbi:MAG: tautomerase family protein [Cytophagales bacterium]|nr:tautomerase family protein [Rhizobacter sp.]
MPLVRISHIAGKSPDYASALSASVHGALVETFGIPEDDLFQIITEHASPGALVAPKTFLGIEHSSELVFIQITCAAGRTIEQKRALYAGIAARAARSAGVRPEDVIINLVETTRENWSFGNGLAQFA